MSGLTHGRLGRLKYLIAMLVILVPAGLLLQIGEREQRIWLYLAGIALALASIVPGVRRLHDTGQSGWFMLISFLPIVNIGLGLYLLLWPGTQGANEFGPDLRQGPMRSEVSTE